MLNKSGHDIKKCIICESESKLTAEHKIKASLLKYFNELENKSSLKELKFNNQNNQFITNIDRAKYLKPKKNICIQCNNIRSQKCDDYFHKIMIEIFEAQTYSSSLKKKIDSLLSPKVEDTLELIDTLQENDPTDNTDWFLFVRSVNARYILAEKLHYQGNNLDTLLIKKYLAKDSICYLDRLGVDIPKSLKNIFLDEVNFEMLEFDIHFLPSNLLLGYGRTLLRFTKGNKMKYSIFFSNLAIKITLLKLQFEKK